MGCHLKSHASQGRWVNPFGNIVYVCFYTIRLGEKNHLNLHCLKISYQTFKPKPSFVAKYCNRPVNPLDDSVCLSVCDSSPWPGYKKRKCVYVLSWWERRTNVVSLGRSQGKRGHIGRRPRFIGWFFHMTSLAEPKQKQTFGIGPCRYNMSQDLGSYGFLRFRNTFWCSGEYFWQQDVGMWDWVQINCGVCSL